MLRRNILVYCTSMSSSITWGNTRVCKYILYNVYKYTVFIEFRFPNPLRQNDAQILNRSLSWPDGSAFAALESTLFDSLEPQNIGMFPDVSMLFYLFLHLDLLSANSFSPLTVPLLQVWRLNFLWWCWTKWSDGDWHWVYPVKMKKTISYSRSYSLFYFFWLG